MKKWTRVLALAAALSLLGSVTAFAAAESEPNNSWDQHNTANYGSNYNLGYLTASDMDWWGLTATRTGRHTIQFNRYNQPYTIIAYSPAGSQLYSGTDSSFTLDLVNGETYRFLVYATSPAANFSYPYMIYIN